MVGTIIKILDSVNAYKDIANIIKKNSFQPNSNWQYNLCTRVTAQKYNDV